MVDYAIVYGGNIFLGCCNLVDDVMNSIAISYVLRQQWERRHLDALEQHYGYYIPEALWK